MRPRQPNNPIPWTSYDLYISDYGQTPLRRWANCAFEWGSVDSFLFISFHIDCQKQVTMLTRYTLCSEDGYIICPRVLVEAVERWGGIRVRLTTILPSFTTVDPQC